ncbi:RNA polymerase subunit sigma-24 [Thioalkalivibrio denitrificans]|uniref:RNA polymerase sigma factor n=1 Tax=Thioalkalivibrio denitrificans TaxID=108003 RepID=A0A1V3ND77_9GAMM|nr:RNA polymerase sigma factor [Thioalkalivibrio denitrificans]OOG23001.1 RNA polymerase subunit sigma-24 [Thioalkalivibrio denitrificans]
MTWLRMFGGASRAWQQQVEESRVRLYRLSLSWCGDEMLADDLAQEALARALRKQHQLRDAERLDAWLFAILHNCWREHLRRLKPQVPLDEVLFVCDHSPEHEQAQDQIVQQVRQAIAALPMGQREVVTLVDLEGLSYAEVAEVMAIPIGTVMSRLSRARRALRAALEPFQARPGVASGRILWRVK